MASGHHEPHTSPYTQDSWGYGQQYNQAHQQQQQQQQQPQQQHSISPLTEYPGFDYGQTSLPMEPAYTMPRPPPYAPVHHPLPPPLVMPQNGVWPSMLASQNLNHANYPTIMPASANHIHTPVSAATSHGSDMTPTSAKSTTRRKLTDDERRQMCLEAEQNPTMKQTQIGAKFNVERSTVSKILRQKEKYMKPTPKEEAPSPGKKSKVKLPDVEKTLANWARNQMKKGIPVTDEELTKQALMFSAGRNDQQMLASASWLEQFKQKHLDPKGDQSVGLTDTTADASPVSSNGLVSPPMSTVDERPPLPNKLEKIDTNFDYDSKDTAFDPHGLSLDLDHAAESVLSPISPELGRIDGLAVNMSEVEPGQFNFSRQRSQTFPHLPEAVGLSQGVSLKAPMMPARSTTSSDIFRDTSIDPRQMMKRHKSVPDIHEAEIVRFSPMQPPPLPKSANVSPISNPASPTPQDDNIRALYSIKQLLEQRPDVAEPDDYVMIGKLLEKLKLLRSPTGTPILPAGMSSMDFIGSPRISKKRTIVGISN